MEKTQNIALFVDGDNVAKSSFQENFDEIKLKGRMCIKRIYFDFNSKLDEKWKSIILSNGIESISVLNLPSKNSTDIRLMLDMIKEYYSNPIIDIYIIMSSDSDFYHIATFLRSNGKKVICYGEKHTPLMLKNVCDEFVLCKNKKDATNTCVDKKMLLAQLNNNSNNNNINNNNSYNNNSYNNNNYNNNYNNQIFQQVGLLDSESSNFIDEEEQKIYLELRAIDLYCVEKSQIPHNRWTQYNYYVEYKNKIYILKDTIESIRLITQNKNLENKNLSALKDMLIRADSSFNEKNWNFYNFKDFVNSLIPNIVITSFDPDRKIEAIVKINIY
jgi:uncharacterized protein (TIGR00288 family)